MLSARLNGSNNSQTLPTKDLAIKQQKGQAKTSKLECATVSFYISTYRY